MSIKRIILRLVTSIGLIIINVTTVRAEVTVTDIMPITDLKTEIGDYVGSIKLSWTYPETFSDASVLIQYATSSNITWSSENAQIKLSTQAKGRVAGSYILGGLDIGRDGLGNDISLTYYFCMWIYTAEVGTVSISSNISTSTPKFPPVGTDIFTTYTDGWMTTYDNNDEFEAGEAVAVDKSGNIYITGESQYDMIIRKYDADGKVIWTKYYNNPGNGDNKSKDISVDNGGNVYVIGSEYRNDLRQNYNIYIRKYDTNGNFLWSRTYNSPDNGADQGLGIAVDNAGNVYVVGYEWQEEGNTLWFGKYDSDGNLLWSQTSISSAEKKWVGDTWGIAVDNAGNLYLTGSELQPAGGENENVWIGKYDTNGNPLWTQVYNNPANGDDRGSGIATDDFGNVYVTGYENRYDLSEGCNLWIGKYNTAGELVWIQTYNNNSSENDNDVGWDIAVDTAGDLYVTGGEYDNLSEYYYYKEDILIQKYSTDGNIVWTKVYNGNKNENENDEGKGIDVDNAGNIYVTGYETQNAGWENIWLRKYTVPEDYIFEGEGEVTFSNESPLSETIGVQKATISQAEVTGGLQGSLNFTEIAFITIKTGGFADKGFSKGAWEATLEGASYQGTWKGMSYLVSSEGKIYLKGVVDDEIYGIVEGEITESGSGTGVYDQYYATWTITRINDQITSVSINISGKLVYAETEEYISTGLYFLQSAIQGTLSGSYIGPVSSVLTLLKVDDENNPYYGKGFAIVSYITSEGSGQGYSYVEELSATQMKLDGIAYSPLYGALSGRLILPEEGVMKVATTEDSAAFSFSITSVEYGTIPEADLKVEIWGPDTASPGQTVSFIVTLKNDGLKAGEDITLTILLPALSDYVSSSANSIYYSTFRMLRWDLQNIPAKSEMKFNFQVKIDWGIPEESTDEVTGVHSIATLMTKDDADMMFGDSLK